MSSDAMCIWCSTLGAEEYIAWTMKLAEFANKRLTFTFILDPSNRNRATCEMKTSPKIITKCLTCACTQQQQRQLLIELLKCQVSGQNRKYVTARHFRWLATPGRGQQRHETLNMDTHTWTWTGHVHWISWRTPMTSRPKIQRQSHTGIVYGCHDLTIVRILCDTLIIHR